MCRVVRLLIIAEIAASVITSWDLLSIVSAVYNCDLFWVIRELACYISTMSKKKKNYWLLLGTLVAPWAIVASISFAESNQSRQGVIAQPGIRIASGLSLQQAINIALSENGGRVLSAQSKNGQGAPRHHIRLLVDGGRVLNVVIDGRGRVKKTR